MGRESGFLSPIPGRLAFSKVNLVLADFAYVSQVGDTPDLYEPQIGVTIAHSILSCELINVATAPLRQDSCMLTCVPKSDISRRSNVT